MICAHCIRRRKALVAEKSKQAAKMIRVAEELRAVLKRYPKKGPAQIKFSVLQRLSREACLFAAPNFAKLWTEIKQEL